MSEIVLPNYIQGHLDRICKENGFFDYSMEVMSGSQIGDGFSSQLAKLKITERNSDKTLHLVCKLSPTTENATGKGISKFIFSREAAFYTKVMPTFAKFQEEKKLPESDQFVKYPKCYGVVIDHENDNYAIILEDLRVKGFEMWPKVKTSPIENIRLTIRELGKFHGLSIAMKNQKPTEFAELEQFEDLFNILFKSQGVLEMFTSTYDYAISSLKCENHIKIMREIRENCLKYFESCLNKKSASYFGVVCHGDFWNNNMMFKLNENDVAEDICIFDWQIVRYGSPVIDLILNIFTTTDKMLRDKEYDNLIQLYYDSLSRTVKLLGSDPDQLFSFDNLQSELKRCGVYALLLSPIAYQVAQASASELVDMSDAEAKGIVGKLSEKGQQEYERLLNGAIDDVVRLGYFQ